MSSWLWDLVLFANKEISFINQSHGTELPRRRGMWCQIQSWWPVTPARGHDIPQVVHEHTDPLPALHMEAEWHPLCWCVCLEQPWHPVTLRKQRWHKRLNASSNQCESLGSEPQEFWLKCDSATWLFTWVRAMICKMQAASIWWGPSGVRVHFKCQLYTTQLLPSSIQCPTVRENSLLSQPCLAFLSFNSVYNISGSDIHVNINYIYVFETGSPCVAKDDLDTWDSGLYF